MLALSFQDKFIKNRKDPIHVIRTQDSSGRNCFYVLLANSRKLQMFKNSDEDCVNINDYGIIISSGFGHEIPFEIKTMLKSKYGFDTDSLK